VDHDLASSSEQPDVEDLDPMVARARAGDREVLPRLRAFLDDHFEVWQQTGDLARHTQDSWVGLIAGTDLTAGESLVRKAAALGSELAGPTASPLERLLVERVVACWLQVHYSDAAVAEITGVSLREAVFMQKRQDAAHRRYLGAIGALAMVRRLVPAAVEPAGVPPKSELIDDLATEAAPLPDSGGPDQVVAVDPARSAPFLVFDPAAIRSSPGIGRGRSRETQIPSAS